MSITAQHLNGISSLLIEGEVTIYSVAELKAELGPWLASVNQTELDLTQVSEIDGAGVQLLLLIQREVLSAGHALHLLGASPAVQDALKLCNVWHSFRGQASIA